MSYPKRPIEYSWHLHTNSIGIPPYNTVDSNKGEVTPTSFIPKKYTASPSLAPGNLTTPNRTDVDNEVHASDGSCSKRVPDSAQPSNFSPNRRPSSNYQPAPMPEERSANSCPMKNRPVNNCPTNNCPSSNRQLMEETTDGCVHSRKVPPSLQAPVGIPAMPLYGYDNCEDSEKDWDYMKQMYPLTAKKILREIIEECDKLEYEGSCMFDEYPDRVYLGRIVDRIYERCSYLDETPVEVPESIMPEGYMEQDGMDIIPYEYVSYRPPTHQPLKSLEYSPYSRNRRPGSNRPPQPPRPGYPPHRPGQQNPWLRNLIEIILFNEMLNRRRRYRGRKSWY